MKIIKATSELLKQFYGEPMKRSCTAYAAVDGDEVFGVVGYYTDSHHRVLFSEMRDEMRDYPILMFKTGKMVVREAYDPRLPLHAVADKNIEASERFMGRLGFVPVTKEVWLWVA